MKYLLDTNTCIYLIKKKPPQVLQKFQQFSAFACCLIRAIQDYGQVGLNIREDTVYDKGCPHLASSLRSSQHYQP